jgi:hypothetical protein
MRNWIDLLETHLMDESVVTEAVSDDVLRWFGDSVVCNPDGSPMRCYHGTNSDFDTFVSLSHFGTALAAQQRLADRSDSTGNARTIPVYLNIEDPLRVTDADASDEATMLNSTIRGKYPDLDINIMRRKGVKKALEDAGYDGMVYRNRMEDRGQDSWVVLDGSQVRSAI